MSKNNSSLGIKRILEIISRPDSHIHFIGVGGAGMSSLFCLSRYFGLSVSGSDREEGELFSSLKKAGAEVYLGSCDSFSREPTLIVYSLAISEDDAEILLAEKLGIPLASRAEYMSALASCYKYSLGISGSHGKSTVTAMLGAIFDEANLLPTVISGAPLGLERANFSLGSLDYFIYESCEYKDSFLCFHPTVSLFLNLEYDHVDYFSTFGDLCASFERAISLAEHPIVNIDDENLARIVASDSKKIISVSNRDGADYTYDIISAAPYSLEFSLSFRGNLLGEIRLPMLGSFNVTNAAMASVVAIESGISFPIVKKALSRFVGIGRRLEKICEWKGAHVYYDYAHHPSEIRAGILALRELYSSIAIIFGAHTYSRTEALFYDFADALSLADKVMLTEISAIREPPGKVSAEELAYSVGGRVVRCEEDISSALSGYDGAVIIMGAANMDWIRAFFK